MPCRAAVAATAVALLVTGGPARAQAGAGLCGAEIDQSAYGNDTFWKPQSTYTVMMAGGQRVLMAEGAVGSNEAAALEAALSQAGNIDEVWLSSPGGNMAQGMKMGRVIHARGLAVRVPEGRACISSCTLAFLGGALRSVDVGAHYGIHMFTVYGDKAAAEADMTRFTTVAADAAKKYGKEATGVIYNMALKAIEQRSAVAAAGLARYLVEMSASLDFLTGMAGQENDGVCFVTRAGLRKYNVVNVD